MKPIEAGTIVELEDRKGLFVVIKEKNYEDMGSCSYERDYYLIPYNPAVDEMKVDMRATEFMEVRSTHFPLSIREDKQPYKQYGYSVIREVETLYFERVWEEVLVPSR